MAHQDKSQTESSYRGGVALRLWIFFTVFSWGLTTVAWGTETEQHPAQQTFSWEMPGKVSIFDLQFGPASFKDNEFKFVEPRRSINASLFPDRLTLVVRFSYNSSQAEVPLKFMIRLPDARQYEETVRLPSRNGQYAYHFTIHNPKDFLGNGSIYLYYGFSIVDVLDFTILPSS
jgi:hypothetical protein